MKVGSLCTGYGGLELALHEIPVPSAPELTWISEIDPEANKVLAARFPFTTNIGDLAGADPEPVDIITAGFPCQPLSVAGHRRGVTDDRWIWDDIQTLVGRMDPRPSMLMLENVPGVLTANGGHAMARIVNGLAALGYVGRYGLLRAADVGACHQRRRWFCIAHTERPGVGSQARDDRGDESSRDQPRRAPLPAGSQMAQPEDPAPDSLPTPQASDGTRGPDYARAGRRDTHDSGGDDLTTAMSLLSTPKRRDHKDAALPPYLEGRNKGSLPEDITTLPTPTASDQTGSRRNTARKDHWQSHPGDTLTDVTTRDAEVWGKFAVAIERHAEILGRDAPPPTTDGKLSPRFVEWMMMLPDGWVTSLDLRRSAQLRILGNGVVPRQAAAAFGELLDA